jgi:hypothetical protein
VIAWCSAYVAELESPNNILYPADYFPALQRMEYSDIPVDCVGPASAAEGLTDSSQIEVRWIADVTLIGDRNTLDKRYEASSAVEVTAR